MKLSKLCILAFSLSSLAGCMSYQPYGTVLPQVDGSYKLVNTGRKESDAMRLAQADAKGTCKDEGKKKFVVVSQASNYIGPKVAEKGQSGMKGMGMTLLQLAAEHENKENYKVETAIQCI